MYFSKPPSLLAFAIPIFCGFFAAWQVNWVNISYKLPDSISLLIICFLILDLLIAQVDYHLPTSGATSGYHDGLVDGCGHSATKGARANGAELCHAGRAPGGSPWPLQLQEDGAREWHSPWERGRRLVALISYLIFDFTVLLSLFLSTNWDSCAFWLWWQYRSVH